MEFKEKILKEYNIDLPIKGGDGASIESPIIIDISQKCNYVSLEKICINYACQSDIKKWVMENQELIIHEGKYIDAINIGISTNGVFEENYKQITFYFDISECIKYSMSVAEFNKVW